MTTIPWSSYISWWLCHDLAMIIPWRIWITIITPFHGMIVMFDYGCQPAVDGFTAQNSLRKKEFIHSVQSSMKHWLCQIMRNFILDHAELVTLPTDGIFFMMSLSSDKLLPLYATNKRGNFPPICLTSFFLTFFWRK